MIDLSRLLQYTLSSLVNIPITLYIIFKLLNVKLDFKNPRLYVTLITLIIIGTLNLYFVNGYIRIIIMTVSIFLLNYYLFRKNFRETLASTFMEQLIALLCELVYAIFLIIYISSGGISVADSFMGDFISNIFISVAMIILIRRKWIHKLYQRILNKTNKISVRMLYIVVLLLIFSLNILLFSVYSELGGIKSFIINAVFILIYFFIMYWALNERNQNIQYKEENNMLVENLNGYGKMLDQQRIANHENKNQLLVISEMIKKKDKGVLEYIDEILKTSKKEHEGVLFKVKRIPSAGLQGLIYQKLCTMKEKGIDFNLSISRDINKYPFQKLTSKTNYDLFRAIGIILDNAIEESLKTEEKEIEISLYIDNGLMIEVSNYCKDIPNLTQIDNVGYTTKEEGHGYGLSLLREIVTENKLLKNEKNIIGNVFVQQIKIKM